jgi:hypothetical protein
MIHELTHDERVKLRQLYDELHTLTVDHHHACPCELCEARALVYPDDEFFRVPYISHGEGDANYGAAHSQMMTDRTALALNREPRKP